MDQLAPGSRVLCRKHERLAEASRAQLARRVKNGAIPPRPYYGVFVTKFDDRGELLWGHQYRAAPLEPFAGTTASADCLASYSAELALREVVDRLGGTRSMR